jgi:hypothetical protein
LSKIPLKGEFMHSFKKFGLIFGMLALLFLAVGLLAGAPVAVSAAYRGSANDAGSGPAALVWAQTSPADDGLPDISNAACLTCHAQPGMQTTLPSGEILYLTVNPEVYGSSVHGAQTQACTACHTDIDGFPHPELTVQTLREYQIEMAQACAACHQDYVDKTADSVHALALEAGNQNAAVCTDCHGAHNVKNPGRAAQQHSPDVPALPF